MWFLWSTNGIPIYDIVERSHSSPCGGGLEWRNVIPVRYKRNSYIWYSRKISLFPVWRRVRIPPPQSLRVVRGDKERHSLIWDSKIWPWVLRDFNLRVTTALARPRSNCTVNYRAVLSSQRGFYKITNPQMSEGNFKEKEKLVTGPRWAPDIKTDWPTVGRKLTST
jgi:hypothetical protein